MIIKRLVQAASIGVAILMMAAGAMAATVDFSTDDPGTTFVGGTRILSSTSGEAATITFLPNALAGVTVPSNANYGYFTLACPTCTTTVGSFFDVFTFDLVLIDQTDNAIGKWVGTSTGNSVLLNSSDITITWVPYQLGPGTSGAISGDFGPTSFRINTTTRIVPPDSGTNPGQTTVQGDISGVPEPATFGLIGGALLGLGLWRRKNLSRA